jgi:hypothetical protein
MNWEGIIILLNSNKNGRLEPKKKKTTNIFKISLILALMAFMFSTSPTSYFGVIKPATAAGTLICITRTIEQSSNHDDNL